MRRKIISVLLVGLSVIGILAGCSSVPDGAEQATPQAEQETGAQETEKSIPVETVTTDTFEMDYFRFGSGNKALVIIPGLSVQSVMGSAELVAEAYSMFADDYTVYLFDRRKNPPDSYSVYDMAGDTAAAFRELGLEKVSLFGASQGGMIAMDIAIEHPELVDKLILGSTSARITDAVYEKIGEWVQLAKEGNVRELYLDFGQKVYSQDTFEQFRDTLEAMAETVTEEELAHFIIIAEGTKGFDVLDKLGRIECPVLLTGSEDDNVLGAEATKQIAEMLDGNPFFEMHMYNGYGHAAYDMAPDYKERMQRFLASGQ